VFTNANQIHDVEVARQVPVLRAYLTAQLGFDIFDSGVRAFIAGGAIRDLLHSGRIAKDIDLIIDATPETFATLQTRIVDRFGDARIDRYKPENWQITPFEPFPGSPGVTIQISRHPAIGAFFTLCTESMNAILTDGTTTWAHPDALADARGKRFRILNFDPAFMTPTRAAALIDRVAGFQQRGYTFQPTELYDVAVAVAAEHTLTRAAHVLTV
jgi:hypothetical protein